MPQGRIVLKSICQSKKIPELKTDGARLLYTWLIPNVDVNGCFSGDPQVIKGQIFTRLKHSIKTIESYLQDLESAGLIIRYEIGGDAYLIIPDFEEKQPSLKPEKEGKPTIPLPTPELLQSKSGVTPPISKVKESKDKVKGMYFAHVFLTNEEYQKLKNKFGVEVTKQYIKSLNDYIGSKGKKYKSHYYTILIWAKRNGILEKKPESEYKTPKAEKRTTETEKKVKDMLKEIKVKKVRDL